MNNNEDQFYGLNIWMNINERSQAWIARRLEISPMTISTWKRENKIPHTQKLAICQVTGATMVELWGEL